MTVYATAYAASLAAFLIVDMIWLGIMVDRVYRPALGEILLSSVNIPPALVFYAIYPVGLVIFAVMPAIKSGSMATAMVYGALFGFFTYATYDLSNYATLRAWTMQVTVIDIMWGTVLGALAAAAGFFATTRFMSGLT